MNEIDIICNIIKTIVNSRQHNDFYYQNGGCFEFYKILKSIYPHARPVWYKFPDHVATNINGNIYDSTGCIGGEMTDKEMTKAEDWKDWGIKKLKNYERELKKEVDRKV